MIEQVKSFLKKKITKAKTRDYLIDFNAFLLLSVILPGILVFIENGLIVNIVTLWGLVFLILLIDICVKRILRKWLYKKLLWLQIFVLLGVAWLIAYRIVTVFAP
jgi:membrane protein YdbS with pleckstrin-like domain